jgi:hypothetical protein
MPAEPAPQRLSPRAAAVLGALFLAAGLSIVLVAAGVSPADENRFRAPRWVVSAAGLCFVLAGVALATTVAPGAPEAAGRPTWRSFLLGGTLVGLMAAIFHWIAFGPGERHFGGGIGLPFVSVSGPASEWTGRAAFGIGAVLMDVLLIWMTARSLRALLGRGR